jgi:cysteine desulfurase
VKRIYLDHTATTPLDDRVFEAMRPYFSGAFGNASSVHSFGRDAKMALEKSRETIAKTIGAQSGEIFLTSGGTESDNFAICGVAHAARKNGKNHLITAAAEHHAVLEPCEMLGEEGFDVTILPVDSNGMVSAEQVRDAITDTTCLVSIMHSNNEVGTLNPIKRIAEAAHARGVLLHSDAVQSLGKVPLNVNELGVDLMTISAHKLYGPKGIGALFIRRGVEIDSLLFGGGQERGRRPGTENVPLAVGFAKAVELSTVEMPTEMQRLKTLRDNLQSRITNHFPLAIINGHAGERLPHILNISFYSKRIQLEGEMLVMNMDLQGVAVSSGSACTSGSIQPSHVLLAMGRDVNTAKATLRFAFGKSNSIEDVDYVVESLHQILSRMSH